MSASRWGTWRSRALLAVVLGLGLPLPLVAAPHPAAATVATADLELGSRHSCALLADGTVRCWGLNSLGQLGDGTRTSRSNPVEVLASGSAAASPVVLSGVTQLSVGLNHGCALLTDGTVRCWGYNAFGQLGDGTRTDRDNPVQVVGLSGVTHLAAGGYHTCAVVTDTTVRCWGHNSDGQVGDGTRAADRLAPVVVLESGSDQANGPRLTTVTQLAVGELHTCAVLADATARCWGEGSAGELGDGAATDRVNPVTVLASGTAAASPVPLTGVSRIAADTHTCALLADGTVRCWGANLYGQLGDGTTTARPNPVEVLVSGTAAASPVALSGVAAIDTGGDPYSCAVLTDGTARCWGRNSEGQHGDGTKQTDRPNPVTVLASGTAAASPVPLAGVTVLATGGTHACALLDDGTARCVGNGGDGRLGDGTTTARLNPVTVLASGTAVASPVPLVLFTPTPTPAPTPTPSTPSTAAASADTLRTVCAPAPPSVGATVRCEVTGGAPGVTILWRAAYDRVVASAGVTLDEMGAGSFTFVVPAAALGDELTIELVAWTAPMTLGVVPPPIPNAVAAGVGPSVTGLSAGVLPGPLLGVLSVLIVAAGVAPRVNRTR